MRKQTIRELRSSEDGAVQEDLKATIWVLGKAPLDLDADEQARLERLFVRAPELKLAYDLRNDLTAIFDSAVSRDEGLAQIAQWERRVEASGVDCFSSFLKRLGKWREIIVNYFIARKSSGFVEGINNKLKVIKRRCYGLTNLGRFFQRIALELTAEQKFSPWSQASH